MISNLQQKGINKTDLFWPEEIKCKMSNFKI